MQTDEKVVAHYRRAGLEQAILDALAGSGHDDLDHLAPADLSGADEFHLGWRPATVAFAAALGLPRGVRVIDIGAGIGGPARHLAETYGVRVAGVDLAPDYVEAANALTRRCGLEDYVEFELADALALPFADATFDGGYTIHAAMNIDEKGTLFAEARRVLRPGARFGVYDIMRCDDGEIPYPMPWAATVATSFVETAETYRSLLEAAGFAIESETDRGDLARDLGRAMREKAATDGPPPLGLHILMGPATPERLGNVMKTLEARTIAPVEIIARAV